MPENLKHLENRLRQSRKLATDSTDISVRISHQEMSKRYVERIAIAKANLAQPPLL